jgi:sec-independent protein translocase protein TatC
LGVFFGYYIVAPLSINFLANYQIDPSIQNEFDIISYVSTLVTLVLACALLFQLPIVIFFLARVGLISPKFMRTYRRHAIIIILVISAIITPPDVFSQVLIAIPLTILYELSIGIALRVEQRYVKEEEAKTPK